jgi:L-alanine-DL-glutamate epimerase-like enolase superfamily enzyme
MKITKVDILQPKIPENPTWRPVLCRIYTDEGIYGDGEAALAYGTGSPAAAGMVEDLARLIIGRNPLDTEPIWDDLYKNTFWGQNGGPVINAGISAIDIALWDIKGKFFGVPVYTLLGGKKRDRLRAYASQLQFSWSPVRNPLGPPEAYAKQAMLAVSEGYDAIKIDFFTYDLDGSSFTPEQQTRLLKPYYLDLVEDRIAAVRDAVGPDVDIIMENHSKPDAQSAIQLGQRAEPYDIFYFEEPTTPNPKMTKLVADNVNIPIASGERIYTRWDYAPYFEIGALSVIQPDIGNTGGLTEAKKIADLAYIYDVSVQAHVCASPLSTAVALHYEAVIPNFVIHEHHVRNLSPENKKLAKYDYQPVKGYFDIPDLPGLGNEISDEAFEISKITTVE